MSTEPDVTAATARYTDLIFDFAKPGAFTWQVFGISFSSSVTSWIFIPQPSSP